MNPQLHITESIWLRAFSTPSKFNLTVGLQIHANRFIRNYGFLTNWHKNEGKR